MAFVKISPQSGSGNGSCQLSADPYQGRNDRSSTVRFQVQAGDQPYVDVSVTNKGLGEVLEMESSGSFELQPEGGTIKITGQSNLKTMRLTVDKSSYISSVSYKINNGSSVIVTPGASMSMTPTGDPGATEPYDFEITVAVGNNTTASSVAVNLVLTNGSSLSESITVTLGAANYLYVRESQGGAEVSSLDFGASGGSQTIYIDTNESWTIE